MICPHGLEMLCKECRADSKQMDREAVRSGAKVWAVLPWRGDGKYEMTQAIKTYKSEAAAERFASKQEHSRSEPLCVRLVHNPG
jgi:hypothetical protein